MITKDINYQKIVDQLKIKASLKQAVYNNTFQVLKDMKAIFEDLASTLNEDYLNAKEANVDISYKENNEFEATLKLGGDMVLVSMHSNIFDFEATHQIKQTKMFKADALSTFCGKINIYNFLSDTIKYNRLGDSGWKVARIFVNKDNHFFTEGNGQLGFLFNDIENQVIDKDILALIIEIAIAQSLENDLLVSPFEEKRFVTLLEKDQMIANAGISVSKSIGYKFSDEIDEKPI